mmetsp:Transcript_54273/g.173996  ORF Transcript_54273/g.173996 Transcript_54273/m.173996 type:complete len:284 (-) Transcript_54273:159-1010(-)
MAAAAVGAKVGAAAAALAEALAASKATLPPGALLAPSPVPSSVCPTEASTASAASGSLGATLKQFSDTSSEVDSEVEAEIGSEAGSEAGSEVASDWEPWQEYRERTEAVDPQPAPRDWRRECGRWVEVCGRLGRVFQTLTLDAEDAEDYPLPHPQRESRGTTATAGSQFAGVLGSRGTSNHHSGHALLEHYEVFGAPSGSWRNEQVSPAPAPAGAAQLHQPPTQENQEDAGAMGLRPRQGPSRRGTAAGGCAGEWRALGLRLARVMHDADEAEERALAVAGEE